MSEDELALFDLLFKDSISKKDRERLKQASQGLLSSLRGLLAPMPGWLQNATTQAEVRIFILDRLYESLPRPPFTGRRDRGHRVAGLRLCLAEKRQRGGSSGRLGVCAAENGATIAGEIGRRKDLMSTTFRRYAPDQSLLLPPDVRAWLPEGHLAHHVSDLVDGLDLTAFYAAYAGDGRRNAPYEPRMMVKVLLYAYATGVFSSRGIARRLEEDVAFRVLAAGNFPQHRTVCEFRRRHLEDFKALFVEVVRLARELGLARFGKLSIDGTKVRANASKHKAMSYGRMQEEERRLAGEIDALVRAARDADAAEDERFGPDARGDELPSELRRREDRLAAIRAAKERLEAAQRAADDAGGRQPGQARNPEGRTAVQAGVWRGGREGTEQLHGPGERDHEDEQRRVPAVLQRQVAVDGEHQLVVATEVTANASDQGGLPLLLDEVAETVGEQPDTVLADAGYSNERDLVNLETRGVDGYVSLGREGKTARPRDPGQYPATESHGREAVEAGGSCGIRRTQVAVGGSARLDQTRAGIPALQPAGAGEGARRVGLGVPGVERQAPARPDRGVTRGNEARDGDGSARITVSGGPRGPSTPDLAICRGTTSSGDRRSCSDTISQSMGRRPTSRRGISCGADS